jgi:hypothetical protein
MLSYGKKIRASRDKNNKYSNSRVVRKKNLNEAKNHNPPPPCKLNGRSLRYINQLNIQFLNNVILLPTLFSSAIGDVYRFWISCLDPKTKDCLPQKDFQTTKNVLACPIVSV